MADDFKRWAAEFAEKNGRTPTFQEFLAHKQAGSEDSASPVSQAPEENWLKAFAEKNGREPTFQEFMAHKQAAAGEDSPAPVEKSVAPVTEADWLKDFEAKNGRRPTFAEFTAHQQAAAGDEAAPEVGEESSAAAVEQNQDSVSAPSSAAADTGEDDESAVPQPDVTADAESAASQPVVPAFAAPDSPPDLPEKPRRHRGRRIVFTVILLLVLAIGGIGIYGLFTERDEAKLGNLFDAAVKDKDTAALLRLFPADQTRSIFAKDGARQIIKQRIAFRNVAKKQVAGLSVTQRPYFIFFKNYYMSTQLTALTVPKQYDGATFTYQNQSLTADDIVANPLFWGDYTFKVKPRKGGGWSAGGASSQTGGSTSSGTSGSTEKAAAGTDTITLGGGQQKKIVLRPGSSVDQTAGTDTTADAAVTVKADGWQTGVPKDLAGPYYQWSGYGTNQYEGFSVFAGKTDKGFDVGTGGLGDGLPLVDVAYQQLRKNLYLVRGHSILSDRSLYVYVKIRYENGVQGRRLAIYDNGQDLAAVEKSVKVPTWFNVQTITAVKGKTLTFDSGTFMRFNSDRTFTREDVDEKHRGTLIGGGTWKYSGNEITGTLTHYVAASFANEADYQAGKPSRVPTQTKTENDIPGAFVWTFTLSKRADGRFDILPAGERHTFPPMIAKFAEHDFSDEQKSIDLWQRNAPAEDSDGGAQ